MPARNGGIFVFFFRSFHPGKQTKKDIGRIHTHKYCHAVPCHKFAVAVGQNHFFFAFLPIVECNAVAYRKIAFLCVANKFGGKRLLPVCAPAECAGQVMAVGKNSIFRFLIKI